MAKRKTPTIRFNLDQYIPALVKGTKDRLTNPRKHILTNRNCLTITHRVDFSCKIETMMQKIWEYGREKKIKLVILREKKQIHVFYFGRKSRAK